MEIINRRGALNCLKNAIKKGELCIGFVGGSITAGDENVGGSESNWFGFIRQWFKKNYADLKLTICNAGIGGTTSLSGLMRARAELIDTGCDIVFVEYAVNDSAENDFRAEEGLTRLLLDGQRDVVFVYTYSQKMYEDLSNDKIPNIILQFESIAQHYNIPSVWSGKYAYQAVKRGELSWEAWLPAAGGNLHPHYLGSMYYAEPVLKLLEEEINGSSGKEIFSGKNLPAAIDKNHFGNITEIPMVSWNYDNTWTKQRELKFPFYKWVLSTSADGAQLSFKFKGKMLAGNFNFGRNSGKILFSVDNGDYQVSDGIRAYYTPDKDWCLTQLFCTDLKDCEHTFKMKVFHGNNEDCKGTDCKIFAFVTSR